MYAVYHSHIIKKGLIDHFTIHHIPPIWELNHIIMFHGIYRITQIFLLENFRLCVVSSLIVNLLGRHQSVQFIFKLTLYFQNIFHVSLKRAYQFGFNSGTLQGVIFLGMTSPMTFQTASDVLAYVLGTIFLLVTHAVKIFDQDHITSKLIFSSCI